MGYTNLLTPPRKELDLTNSQDVQTYFATNKPEYVFLIAAKVGGIYANMTYRADFIFDNLMMQSNAINASKENNVTKIIFVSSGCVYPKWAENPISEDAMLTGTLEPSYEHYSIAKIAGIKMCESYNRQYGTSHGIDYRSVMPTNLYGPGDNYHPENSHVIPALIRRFHEAKMSSASDVVIWGTGTPKREFLYVDDMATASIFVMDLNKKTYDQHTEPMQSHINVGFGGDVTIAELAKAVGEAVGYQGNICFDSSKPDGSPRKWMDSGRLNRLGWKPKMDLAGGLRAAYSAFVK
jgi:GDP-L-fucose synthase